MRPLRSTLLIAGVLFAAAGVAHAQSYGYGMMGYGPGYGMMGPGMMGYGPGYGMMGYGPGYGMGLGMMGYGPGYGMMGYGPGYGMGPGMMGYGPGYGRYNGSQNNLNLTTDQVKTYLEQTIRNPNLKVGEVKEKNDDTIVADIVTKDKDVLVQRLQFNRRNGFVQPEQ